MLQQTAAASFDAAALICVEVCPVLLPSEMPIQVTFRGISFRRLSILFPSQGLNIEAAAGRKGYGNCVITEFVTDSET